MNIIDQVIKYAPKYVPDVVDLIFERKKFAASICRNERGSKSLFFLLYTIMLVAIAVGVLFSLKSGEIIKLATIIIIPFLFYIFALAGLAQAVWHYLGGSMSPTIHLAFFTYLGAAGLLIMLPLTFLLREIYAIVDVFAPGSYVEVWGVLFPIRALVIGVLLFVIMVGFNRWVSPFRQAFREMNPLSRGRSLTAHTIYFFAWPFALVAMILVYRFTVRIALGT